MTLRAIADLPVGQLLRAGGVAWVWYTWPLSAAATSIIEGTWIDPDDVSTLADGRINRRGWGLKVKTGGAWAKRTSSGKLRWGPGYIIRSVCEPFAICTIGDAHGLRGRAVNNLIETITDLSLDGVARRHSEKPDEAYALLEALLQPGMWCADVFSRTKREGWDDFGNEAGKFGSAGGGALDLSKDAVHARGVRHDRGDGDASSPAGNLRGAADAASDGCLGGLFAGDVLKGKDQFEDDDGGQKQVGGPRKGKRRKGTGDGSWHRRTGAAD
jgi:N6-adenosine-specific RNA methylase IME4